MQNRRALMFLILAVALGVFAAFTAQRWLEQQRQQPTAAQIHTQPVAVMRQNLQVGQVVHERSLAAGEPVLENALLPEGSRAGLASVIDPTHRAMSVRVDPVVGVAGFVTPGARVDVLVTINRVDSDGKPVSKVILQDVQVLAIDQKLEEAKEGQPELVQVVTLETSPQDAEKLTHAAHEGRLQLALRNPSDHGIAEARAVGVADVLGDRRPAPKIASRPVA